MPFAARETARQLSVKHQLFSAAALATEGTYRGHPRPFCLDDRHAAENLWHGLRAPTIAYFTGHDVSWHQGARPKADGQPAQRLPSNHLRSSQVFCVNTWAAYASAPEHLRGLLSGLGYPVADVLPMGDEPAAPLVAFEWIGKRNYLAERGAKRQVGARSRRRGQHVTSADFAVRFRRTDGKVQIVLGEWKYTEAYDARNVRVSERGTDRLAVYVGQLHRSDSPFAGMPCRDEDLFYEPFYQLMRLQLLAAAMERAHELDADLVSVLHVAPRANRELMGAITSPGLTSLGSDLHEVWTRVVGTERFAGRHVEDDVLPRALAHAPDPDWARWMQLRYGALA